MAKKKKVTKKKVAKKVTKKKVAKKVTKKKVAKKATTRKKLTGYPNGKNPNSLANLKPAQKGEVRNPNGARTHDKEKKALKKMTNAIVKDIINTSLVGNLNELNAIVKDPNSSAMQVGIATALGNAIKKGDWGTLKNIVQTLVGKEPDKVDITSKGKAIDGSPVTKVLLKIPSNGRTREENE